MSLLGVISSEIRISAYWMFKAIEPNAERDSQVKEINPRLELNGTERMQQPVKAREELDA